MAITIIEDLVPGSYGHEDMADRIRVRRFHVDGVAATPASNFHDRVMAAVDSTRPGVFIPRVGDPHPTVPETWAQTVAVEPFGDSRSAAVVSVTYRGFPTTRLLRDVRINGASIMTATEVDQSGQRIYVGYHPDKDATATPAGVTDAEKQAGWQFDAAEIGYFLPNDVVEFYYREPYATAPASRPYKRKVNGSNFLGRAPGCWLCTDINTIKTHLIYVRDTGVVNNTGQITARPAAVERAYVFRLREYPNDAPGWRPLLMFVNRKTGSRPADINPVAAGWPAKEKGNGWISPVLYDSANFDDLNLLDVSSLLA